MMVSVLRSPFHLEPRLLDLRPGPSGLGPFLLVFLLCGTKQRVAKTAGIRSVEESQKSGSSRTKLLLDWILALDLRHKTTYCN